MKQKLEDTIVYAYGVFQHFPKSERFTLVADLKQSFNRLLILIVRANKTRNKLPLLFNADVELEVLRSLIRLSYTLKFINVKKYEILSLKISEVGRLLGGWIKQNR